MIAAALGGAASLAVAVACNSSTTPNLYTPITGLVIDSSTLVQGVGCGTQADQVYKYAAIANLAGSGERLAGLPASGVFDCFTDGQFANLPTPDGGTTAYTITIYAFDRSAFPAALGACADVQSDAACPGDDPGTVEKYAGQATWTTTCTASQEQGVSDVAVCGALARTSDASVGDDGATEASSMEAGDAASVDGGDAAPAEASTDGAGDAVPPSEAGDGGATEAAPGDGAATD